MRDGKFVPGDAAALPAKSGKGRRLKGSELTPHDDKYGNRVYSWAGNYGNGLNTVDAKRLYAVEGAVD